MRKRWKCPNGHGKMLMQETQYGIKQWCRQCDMVSWNNSSPADKETRWLRQQIMERIREEPVEPTKDLFRKAGELVLGSGGVGQLDRKMCQEVLGFLGAQDVLELEQAPQERIVDVQPTQEVSVSGYGVQRKIKRDMDLD